MIPTAAGMIPQTFRPGTFRRLAGAALMVGPLLPLTVARADPANTAAVVSAANTFMAPLTTAQKTPIDASSSASLNTSCLYHFSLTNAEVWSNLPVSTTFSGATRNGLIFSSLNGANQANALAVATTALSPTGKKLLDDVRAADRYISGEVPNARGSTSSMWGYNKYFIAFVGTPSTTSPWTFQFLGHHLAYNVTYNGTYTSATPMFAGSEPNSWTDSTGTYAPLGAQRTLLESLRPSLPGAALLSGTFSDVVFGSNGSGPGNTSGHDTVQPKTWPKTGRGVLYNSASVTDAQRTLIRSYIESWVNFMHPSIASELLAIYESPQALAETYVGYAGSSTTLRGSNNYFRVDGPRLWIEFSVQGGVYDMSGYHDHGVFRDKLADYGAAYGTATIQSNTAYYVPPRPPAITTPPASQTVTAGNPATLSVMAASTGSGTPTLTYQWFKDGTAIAGATAAAYPITSTTSDDAGSYAVRVISTGGLTTSSAATLTVVQPFAAFLSDHGLTGVAPEVDSDGDGISNLLEFVLGGNPEAPNTGILPTSTVNASGALVYTFYVRANLGTVTWTAEASTDLRTFTAAADGQNGVTITGAPSGTTGYNLVTVTIPNPSTTGAPLFARLRATLP